MKQIVAAVALAILPMFSVAEPIIIDLKPVDPIIIDTNPHHDHFDHGHSALRAARELVTNLTRVADQASYEANISQDYYRQRQYQQFSRNTDYFARELQQDVVSPLEYGTNPSQVLYSFQRLDYSYNNLTREYQSLSTPPNRIRQGMNAAQQNYWTLSRALQSGFDPGPHPGPCPDPDPFPGPHPDPFPGPHPDPFPGPGQGIYASCLVDIQGDYSPVSSVQCDISGLGATRYDVLVNGRMVWQGRLQPNLQSQYLQTDRRSVGGYQVRYEVYVTLRSGQRQLVFQQ